MHLSGTMERIEGQVDRPRDLLPGRAIVTRRGRQPEAPVIRGEQVRDVSLQLAANERRPGRRRLPLESGSGRRQYDFSSV
jgi:hypothetical protein